MNPSFGAMLLATHIDCAHLPATVLDATLTERVRQWVAAEHAAMAEVVIEAASPFEHEIGEL